MSNTYEENVNIWKKAYQDIINVCEKYPGFNRYSFRDIDDMLVSAKGHLMLIEWYEKYGLKISHDYNPNQYDYINLGEHTIFSKFYEAERDKARGEGKYISWSDDGQQPKNEWLFLIRFPTGAYIFGKDYDYQQELFKEFIVRLKSYKPDYSDTMNRCFYWKLKNAKPIFDDFSSIIQEFQEKNKSEFKRRRADKLRKELAELEEKP